ncbi:ABC transporter ATP-binding protein [Liquorilactobacillus sucicola]|uniref:ABC transporter ATP-binding protein n=2 Tax=Liquorilactobacillus sucicola TaxID=519050 RepID=UPI0007052E04|nr:ATP-binding cassette domain-containing protein [Liquorilactobacillus sucicola]
MLKLEHVEYLVNKKNILSDINLEIKDGEKVAFIGPSGSGKSSLLQLINGVATFFNEDRINGTLSLKNKRLSEWSANELTKIIGNVFQDPRNQFFAKNVADELTLRLGNFLNDTKEIQRQSEKITADFKLEGLLKQSPAKLSSGQKQSVAFAVATSTNPELLVMDEPSANLDLPEILHIRDLLLNLPRKTSLIIAEHRLFYLLPVIDRFIYLKDGQIKAEFTPHQLKSLTAEQRSKMGLRSLEIDSFSEIAAHIRQTEQKDNKLLTAMNVSFGYNRRQNKLLREIGLAVTPGESIGLIGKNGVGKSTFAKLLAGLITPTHGKIFLENKRASRWRLQKEVWYVMQETTYQLFADSVWRELFLNLEQTPVLTAEAEQLLRDLKIGHLKERHPATLSGGEKQRLVLATALLHHPKILILDEPSSGLDQESLQCIIRVIRKHREQFSTTFLTISHDPQFLYQVCERVLVFKKNAQPLTYNVQGERYSAFFKLFL